MRVDAHQHYWKIGRGDYGWLTPKSGILYRDYMPEDLVPHLHTCGIDLTVVVQAAPTVGETEFLLSLCEQEPTLAGAVGWLDLEADHFAAELDRLRAHPYFVGLRPMLQDISDDGYILRPKVLRALERMAELEVPLDILIFPRHLPHIKRMLEQVPGLKAVIDHLAKPPIASGALDPWREQMEAIAADHPNVSCKLSGMVTEARPHAWQPADFVPYVHHIVSVFGPNRILFGSDWPVCLQQAEYGDVVRLLEKVLPDHMTREDRDKLFGWNAVRFYGLDRQAHRRHPYFSGQRDERREKSHEPHTGTQSRESITDGKQDPGRI